MLPSKKGEDGSAAKLTWNEVRKIRSMRKSGMRNTEIAESFPEICYDTISKIVTGKTWKESE
jgi:uncharacterized protein (DUF433 family)